MSSYSNTVVDDSGYRRPVEGVQIFTLNRDGSTATGVSPQPAMTDAFGAFTIEAPDGYYQLDYRLGGVSYAKEAVTIGTPPETVGPPGASDNTYILLAAFKASDIGRKTASLVGVPGVPDGRFNWTLGDYTGQADDVNIIKADSTALSVGAWVRQGVEGLRFKQSGGAAVNRTMQDKAREVISVLDYGAVGDGVTDDWPGFNAAILAAQAIVQWNGANVGVAAEIVVPFRPAGYVLGATLNLYPGIILRFLAGSQLISKTHANDMYLLKGGAQIIGGDHRGGLSGSLAGHCFRLEDTQGRQRVLYAKADTGWIDEVLYYEIRGGSQSSVENCTLTAGSGKYASKVADGFIDSAVPRKIINLETNGGLGIDFGGCNDFMVVGGFCGGLKFSIESRGVHIHALRVANQPTIDIMGHGMTLGGGWNPVPTFKNAVDHTGQMAQTDNIVWTAYCNSGRPIDQTGNSRNSINFHESAVVPVLRSDATALTLTSYRTDWGVKRSGATYTFRLDLSCNLTGGVAAPGGMGLGFLYIDMPSGCFNYGAEQIVQGLMMDYTISGTNYTRPILARVQPIGGNDRAQLYDMNMAPITGNQAPGGTATPGWVLKRLYGAFDYSPA